MKRIYTVAIMGLMVGAMLLAAGCKKEGGGVVLRARIAQETDAKVYMNGNQACWHEGDWVNINGVDYQADDIDGTTASFYGTPQEQIYYAVYPAGIVNDGENDVNCGGIVNVTLPDEQVYAEDAQNRQIVKVPLGGVKDGEDSQDMTLYPLSSLIRVVLSSEIDFTLERIELTALGHALSGAGTATITEGGVGNTITMASSDTSHTVALDFAASGNQQIRRGERNTYVYYIAVPSYTGSDNITITLWGSHRGRGVAKIVEKEGVTLSRNSVASVFISVKGEWDWEEEVDPNELSGVFSIGNGRTVRFSRGNLQYNTTSQTWQFAQNQYDFIGEGNINVPYPPQLGSVIDLFCWGTWAPGGCSPTIIADNELYDYPTSWYSSYSGIAGEWYTMSGDEWEYLLYNRPGGEDNVGLSYIEVGDEEILGLVLLPDEWELPDGCYFDGGTIVSSEGDGEVNYFSSSQWAAMEAAGAVFLPAAGERYRHIEDPGVPTVPEGYLSYFEGNGNYWTRSVGSSDITAKALLFDYDGIDYGTVYVDDIVCLRANGYSVRLVKVCTGSKNGNVGKKRIK